MNCNKPGHWITGCWSKEGGAEGNGPCQKKRQKKKSDTKDKKKKRGKDRMNQAVKDDSNSESCASDAMYMATAFTYSSHLCYQWVFNSGSTTHIYNNKSTFSNLISVHSTIGSIEKNRPQLDVHVCGKVHIICSIDGRDKKVIALCDVTFCPNTCDNLISKSRMDHKGMDICKQNGKVTIRKLSGKTVMQGSLQSITNCSLYIMDCTIAPPLSHSGNVAFSAQYEQSLNLWHWQYAHIHKGGLHYLAKHKLVTGLDIQTNGELGPCEGCALGKHHQSPFLKKASQAENIFNRLHTDLQGPLDTSVQRFRYTLAVIDDCSRLGWK
jgi:hypothetical protein